MYKAFLIKYAEIAIKGKNRYIFEDALVDQIRRVLKSVDGSFDVVKERGRIYVFARSEFDYEEIVEALKRVLVFTASVLPLYCRMRGMMSLQRLWFPIRKKYTAAKT